MNANLPKALFACAFLFGVAATALGSWPATVCAALSVLGALVEMFMRRTVFETRLLEMQGDFKNTAKELRAELHKHTNELYAEAGKQHISIGRINNKLGIK